MSNIQPTALLAKLLLERGNNSCISIKLVLTCLIIITIEYIVDILCICITSIICRMHHCFVSYSTILYCNILGHAER